MRVVADADMVGRNAEPVDADSVTAVVCCGAELQPAARTAAMLSVEISALFISIPSMLLIDVVSFIE